VAGRPDSAEQQSLNNATFPALRLAHSKARNDAAVDLDHIAATYGF
jgi:hypothetical protein